MSFIERNFQEIENYFACCDNSKKRKLEDHNHGSQKTKSLKINTVDDDVSRQRYITRMEKRNERERKRVQLVNKEFDCLRDIISNSEFFKSKLETNVFFDFSNLNRIDMENNLIYADLNSSNKENIYPLIDDCDAYNTSHKKLSKLKTLKLAIEYINYLSDLLNNDQSTVELKREYQSNESSSFDSSNFYFHNIMVCINNFKLIYSMKLEINLKNLLY